jgi:uncharacterized membrane protein
MKYNETFAVGVVALLLLICFCRQVLQTSGRTALEVVYVSLGLTLVECSFVAGARFRRDDTVTRVSTVALTLLIVTVGVGIAPLLQPKCPVAEALVVVLAFCVCSVTGLHFTVNGDVSVSSILTVRIGTTVIVSLTHLVVLVHGRNRSCPP